ncbi:hypothetical protein LCGC14_1928880 [marine sediment metagenome]|uniref:Uncharacterized protein n=1 Tax=marine sediment metagenome TaxID=412755 RepID=A0A0F9I2G7_9ZZZZ
MGIDYKFPTEVIDLPSHGWFYKPDSPLASGQIELKYMTAREEDILTSRNLIQKGVVLDRLLQALIVGKDFDYGQLLTGDKNGIYIASRILAYGKDYKANITCRVCGVVTATNVDLTQLDEKEVPKPDEPGKNEFTFKLPGTGRTLIFKLLTHADEEDITAELENATKLGSDVEYTISTRLKYIILAVDGNADKQAVRDFVDNEFLARDAKAFRDYYYTVNPDVDMSYNFVCPKCNSERRITVPLGIDFFWPES